MSSIDPENGDIIENPDPEADSEISDFTNATEDEFHLNNYAEDEYQLNNSTSHENVNTNDHIVNIGPGFERNEIDTQTNKISVGIESESRNATEIESRNVKDSENRNTVEDLEQFHINNSSENGQTESVTEQSKSNSEEGELVEAETDISDSFEAPESELGHDVPEAELCQLASINVDSSQIQTDKEDLDCPGIGTVESEEQEHGNEKSGLVGSPVVPQTLKLTKSESVESYEPECDQESLPPSIGNVDNEGKTPLQQSLPPCNQNTARETPSQQSLSPCDVSSDTAEGTPSQQSLPSSNGTSNTAGGTPSQQSLPPCDGSSDTLLQQNDYNCIIEENQSVETRDSEENVSNSTVNTENSCSDNSQNDNIENYENDHMASIERDKSSQNKTCVQDNSSQDNEITNMQISCGECENNGNNSNLTSNSENISFSGECVKHNTEENIDQHNMEENTDQHNMEENIDQHNIDQSEQMTAKRLKSPVSEDELLFELDSALGSCDNKTQSDQSCEVTSNQTLINDTSSVTFEEISKDDNVSEEAWTLIQNLQHKLSVSRQQLQRQGEQLQRSNTDYSELNKKLETVIVERDRYLKDVEIAKKHNADDLYIPQIKELEFTISQQQQEIRGLRDKLSSHDSSAKRAINALQVEMKQRIDQVTKVYRDAVSEKDNMVIKYAQAEKNNISHLKSIERLDSKLKDAAKEKDGFLGKMKDLKIEKTRLGHELDLKSSESQTLKKEAEKLREQVSSSDVRIKWAQNKLRAELDGHKDTKVILEKTNQRLKEAKEETEQIRKNCQEIIKTYQESEEIKSNSLDQQLKEKQNELLLHQTENKDKAEVFTTTMKELEKLKIKHRETLAELHTYQDKTLCLEEEHKTDEDTLNKFKHLLQKQKSDNKVLQDKVEEMVQLQADFKRAQKTIKSLDTEISELKINNKDLLIEIDACHKREAEKLELTEKLSAKNAELQSENSLLNDKVIALSVEVQSLKMDINSHESNLEDLSKKLSDETTRSKQLITQLEEKVKDKSKKVDELSTKIDDEKDEIKTLKRKHINSIKDLTRQLQQARRKLEALETNGEKDSASLGSRTSSTGSLNTITNGDGPNHLIQQVPAHTYRQASPPEQEYPVITEQVEPDKQMMIERIVKLQRMLARRNEKIEFMDDHTHQLIDDLQKKNRIIQMYALREESGMLTPESTDISKQHQRPLTKAQIARKHSIMGSVYSSHQTDGTMTIDLSLEINRKLQAVLEDTLIKNMTLKESLDTLGEEIARLSQENRKMQLQLEKQKS